MKKKTPKNIPLDRDVVLDTSEFFGRSFRHVKPEEKVDQKLISYLVKKTDFDLDYSFKTDQLSRYKDKDNHLSLGRRASKLWLTLIALAKEQGRGTSGCFQMSDICRLWNVQKSGKLYQDIRTSFKSLSSVRLSFTGYQKIKGKRFHREWGYSFINEWEILKEDKEAGEALFTFTLNEKALGDTAHWLRYSKLPTHVTSSKGYLSYPVSDLSKKDLSNHYINFIERIRLLPNGTSQVMAKTILEEYIKLDDGKLKRKKYCVTILNDVLSQAVSCKEINNFEVYLDDKRLESLNLFDVEKIRNWQEKVKISFAKEDTQTTVKKIRRKYYEKR